MNTINKTVLVTGLTVLAMFAFGITQSYATPIPAPQCGCQAEAGGDCGCQDCGCQDTVIEDCGCQECTDHSCRRCRSRSCGQRRKSCGRKKCPECENCSLEVKESEVEKTCFQTEQKVVCIPKVRLPWQKCCPPTSRSRVVTVLKTHKYKCPSCSYQWSEKVPECPTCQPSAPVHEILTDTPLSVTPRSVTDPIPNAPQSHTEIMPAQPAFEYPQY